MGNPLFGLAGLAGLVGGKGGGNPLFGLAGLAGGLGGGGGEEDEQEDGGMAGLNAASPIGRLSPLLMGAAWMGGDKFAQSLHGLQQKLNPPAAAAAPAGIGPLPGEAGIEGDTVGTPGAGLSPFARLSRQRLRTMDPEDRRDMVANLLATGSQLRGG